MNSEIRTYFEAEAKELIDRLTRGTASLGAGPAEQDQAAIADMLRAAHTLKGAAHVVGERRMAALAHDFEDGLAAYRKQASKALAETLLALADGLAAELAGSAAPPAPAPAPAARPQPEPPPEPVSPNAAAESESLPRRPRQTVRIEAEDARRLLDALSGSGLRVGTVGALLARLEELEGKGTPEMRRIERAAVRLNMADELDRLGREMLEMHRVASQLRLGSAESLLLDAGRVARATAAAQGKQVRCLTAGERERVEIPLLEAMADALLHLVRNAVAHGIESAAERRAAAKPPVATIRVTVSRRGNDAVFTCSDDGRGIDLEAIRRVAVTRGDLTAGQAAHASAADLFALLLRPGFSLSGAVDEVSGRGVGLDAVREAAARVRGRVEISSVREPGPQQGTTFRVIAPQALFAIRALEVEAGGRRFELPLAHVEQTLRLDQHLKDSAGRTQTLLVGRETMSFAWLDDAFPGGTRDRTRRAFAVCLVLAEGARRMAIGVDRMVGLSDVLVLPVPAFAGVAGYVAGTAMGPDGVPRPVIDAAALLDFLAGPQHRRFLAASPSSSSAQPVAEHALLPILVVDDSLTTRMLEQSILEAEGYEVELATSAEQGLAMARAKHYALFLVDVEMPGMNGYEFVATVTADETLRRTPAIMVTSLDSPESRERGRAAGAYSYIVKGEFNQAVYLDRIRSVVGFGSGREDTKSRGAA